MKKVAQSQPQSVTPNRRPPAIISLWLRVQKHSKEGKLLHDSGLIPSRSFLLQFLEILAVLTQSDTKMINDYTGVSRSCSVNQACLNIVADVENYGIVVGTGTTAPTNADYWLESKIANGAGAGQLQHGSMGFVDPVVAGPNVDYYLSKQFTNASGGTIIIKEVGISARMCGYASWTGIVRDLYTLEVLDTELATITYLWRTTV